MTNDLERLIRPPSSPVDSGSATDWEAVQDRIGLRLPRDLYQFSVTYGTGRLCNGEIHVFNPFSSAYENRVESYLEMLRGWKRASPDDMPYAVHPQPGGLYPWADDYNGNTLFWHTVGSPEEWGILVLPSRGSFQEWKMTMLEFLVKAFTNKIECAIWYPFEPGELNFKASH